MPHLQVCSDIWDFSFNIDKFANLESSVSSTENDIDTRLAKAWTAINRLSVIRKLDLTDRMQRSFFQAAVVSILLYGCTNEPDMQDTAREVGTSS